MRWSRLLVAAVVVAAGCDANTPTVFQSSLPAPANLTYELDPSGNPNQPAGILLAWSDVSSPSLQSYRVYSRGSTSGSFGLRGETTSNTFHDNGVPDLQYYVTAVDVDGNESDASNVITVDERLQLEAPASLTSISLDGAVQLDWADNAFAADPADFKWYRVYSASYNLDSGFCGTDWVLEGETVSPAFLVGALVNGVPRCYGVSTISVNGYESLWSPLRQDTPRPDARNVVVYSTAANQGQSGFRFWDDVNGDSVAEPGELGLIGDGTNASFDFYIYRNPADSTLWIAPQFSGTSVQLYGAGPVADLDSIDSAPDSGYARAMLQAKVGYGYVFQIVDGTTLHYGALRVTDVEKDHVIFDWSFQTDFGNPELVRRAGLVAAAPTGGTVRARP